MASTFLGEPLMVKSESPGGVSLDQSRRATIEALESVATALREDSEHGAAVRHFESIINMLAEMRSGSLSGWDPLLAARSILEQKGRWMPANELAKELHAKGVSTSGTKNQRKQPLRRRALEPIERLQRLLLQAVNHQRLQGCKIVEGNLEITKVGLNEWKIPAGATRMEPKGQNAGRKKKRK